MTKAILYWIKKSTKYFFFAKVVKKDLICIKSFSKLVCENREIKLRFDDSSCIIMYEMLFTLILMFTKTIEKEKKKIRKGRKKHKEPLDILHLFILQLLSHNFFLASSFTLAFVICSRFICLFWDDIFIEYLY